MRSAPPIAGRDAAATRTLACTAMRMPNWPTVNENNAPMIKAMRAQSR